MATRSVWRCPGCGTLQTESAECFVCNRSAISCATCANFRRSVAASVGYCAIDRRREPLSGDERRPCWTDASAAHAEGLFAAIAEAGGPRPAAARHGLIELDARDA